MKVPLSVLNYRKQLKKRGKSYDSKNVCLSCRFPATWPGVGSILIYRQWYTHLDDTITNARVFWKHKMRNVKPYSKNKRFPAPSPLLPIPTYSLSSQTPLPGTVIAEWHSLSLDLYLVWPLPFGNSLKDPCNPLSSSPKRRACRRLSD